MPRRPPGSSGARAGKSRTLLLPWCRIVQNVATAAEMAHPFKCRVASYLTHPACIRMICAACDGASLPLPRRENQPTEQLRCLSLIDAWTHRPKHGHEGADDADIYLGGPSGF